MAVARTLRESDLYQPVRDYLAAQGYVVRGEVKDCDLTATKGDDLIVVELKRSLNLDLLVQATARQRLADSVYVAVPRPSARAWRARGRGVQHVLRRLELGLIFVMFGTRKARVEIVLHPEPFTRRRQQAKRRALLVEMAGRSGDYNAGGSTRRKLVTAYREQALQLVALIEGKGPCSPKDLRMAGASAKAGTILYDNVYGWFQRVERGIYQLTPQGREALAEYADIVALFRDTAADPAPTACPPSSTSRSKGRAGR